MRPSHMRTTVPLACLLLTACSTSAGPSVTDDDDQAAAEDEADTIAGPEQTDDGKPDQPGWGAARTLHVGETELDLVAAGDRRVHALWLDGSPADPIALEVAVEAVGDGDAVRVAVLGPLEDGQRQVVAADGYSSPTHAIELAVRATERGQHLVVIGSYQLASDAAYTAAVRCAPEHGCDPDRVDVLAEPKTGALAGGGRLIAARLGRVLAERATDVELEVWTSPPGQRWNAELAGVSVASGDQMNALVPDGLAAGDDLLLVVREAGGAVLDTGVLARFAPEEEVFARLDSIVYGDLASLTISGVTGYFEGTAELELRSQRSGHTIAAVVARSERPGQLGTGLAAFDATFAPWISDDDGNLNPDLPRNGELLSVGRIGGNGDYLPFGCFEYCNDLGGEDSCTGGPRACP